MRAPLLPILGLVLISLVSTGVRAGHHAHGRTAPVVVPAPVVIDPSSVERILDELQDSADELRDLAATHVAPGQQRALLDEVQAIRADVRELRRLLRQAPPAPGTGPYVPGAVVRVPPRGGVIVHEDDVPMEEGYDEQVPAMSEAQFQDVLRSMSSHGFSSEQLEVLADVTETNWFFVDQAGRVLELFSFGKDKLAALKLLAPRLLDRQSGYKLYEAFSFEADKKEARRILAP